MMASSSGKNRRKQTRHSSSFVQRDSSPTNAFNLNEAISPIHLERSARRCSDGSFGLRLESCLNNESFDMLSESLERRESAEGSPKTDYTYIRSGSYDRQFLNKGYISPNMSRRRIRADADDSGASILLDPPDGDLDLSRSWEADSPASAQFSSQTSRTATSSVTSILSGSNNHSEISGSTSLPSSRRKTVSFLPGDVQDPAILTTTSRRRRSDEHYYRGMVLRSGHRLKGLTQEQRERALAAAAAAESSNHLSVGIDITSSGGQSWVQANSDANVGANLRSSQNLDGSYIVKTVTEEWFYDDEHDGGVGSGRSGRKRGVDTSMQTREGLRRSARRATVQRDLSDDFEVEKAEYERMEKGATDAEQREGGAFGNVFKNLINNSYSSVIQASDHDYGKSADVSDDEEDYTVLRHKQTKQGWFSSVWTTVTETMWETSVWQKAETVTSPVQRAGWWLWQMVATVTSALASCVMWPRDAVAIASSPVRRAGWWLWQMVTTVTSALASCVLWPRDAVTMATSPVRRAGWWLWQMVATVTGALASCVLWPRDAVAVATSPVRRAGWWLWQMVAMVTSALVSGVWWLKDVVVMAMGSVLGGSQKLWEAVSAVANLVKRSCLWLGSTVSMVTSPLSQGGWWIWSWVHYLAVNLLLVDVLLLERTPKRGVCCCLCLPLLLLLPLLLGGLLLSSQTGSDMYSLYQSSDQYLLASFLPKSSSQESWFFGRVKEAPAPPIQVEGRLGGGSDGGGKDRKVQFTGLGVQDVERIVDAALARNMDSVRSELAAMLKQDQDRRVQAQNSLQLKLEAFQTAITAMNEKSETITLQMSTIKAHISEQTQEQKSAMAASLQDLEARLQTLQLETAALKEEQAVTAAHLSALEGETTDLKAGLVAMAAMARNCCRNETALALAIRSQVMAVLSQISEGGGGEGDEDGSRTGFLAWLGQHYISRSDYEAELSKFADEITRKLTALAKEQAALGESLAASSASHREADDATAGGLVAINEDYIRLMVDEALAKFNADKTGMADYALESAGGSVLSTRCSETYYRKTALVSIFGIPLWYTSNSPRTVIQPDVHPGQCWAFAGPQGTLVVELAVPIKPSGFSLEHIPKSLSPTGNINSAPKDFTVLGLADERDSIGKVLGNFTYIDEGKPIQFFPVQVDDVAPYRYIELRITSNHGNLEYTCLYRFRVHGTPYEE